MQIIGFGNIKSNAMQVSFPHPILKIYIVPNVAQNKHKRKGKRNSQFLLLGTLSTIIGSIKSYRANNGSIWDTSSRFNSLQTIIDQVSCRYFHYRASATSCFFHFPPSLDLRDGICRNKRPHTCCLQRTSSFNHQKPEK